MMISDEEILKMAMDINKANMAYYGAIVQSEHYSLNHTTSLTECVDSVMELLDMIKEKRQDD